MDEKTRLEFLDLESCCEFIEDNFGIDLLWGEKAGLKQYLGAFEKRVYSERWPVLSHHGEAVFWFMKDYFGIYTCDVDDSFIIKNNAELQIGMDFLGTPEFKEYCKGRVEQWRDERNLL